MVRYFKKKKKKERIKTGGKSESAQKGALGVYELFCVWLQDVFKSTF